MNTVKFEYCPILGLKSWKFETVKEKHIDTFYVDSKYFNKNKKHERFKLEQKSSD